MSQSISEEFIRDVTQVQPRPKSEVRSRLNEIISQALIAERKELREKLTGRYTRIKSRLEDAVGSNDYKMRGQIEMIDDLLCYLEEISLPEEK